MLWFLGSFIVAFIYGSFFEWILHRYVMHKKVRFFDYPFVTHALVHHKIFKSDHTYHVTDPKHAKLIPMAWWNGPALIIVSSLPMLTIAYLLNHWSIAFGALTAAALYYGAYEYLHWCMHKPKARRVEKSGLFFRLNGHHLLHHRYMNKNFNTVFPLADLCLGTLLLRSKVKFAQATGPAVPNVQPKEN